MKVFSAYSKYFLFTGLIILVAVVAAVSGAKETSAHCCRPTATPTFTPSPTATFTVMPTPTPALQACQVVGIIFSQESYFTSQTIEVTVRLADHAGTPLVGANVAAEVTRQPLSAQASTGFGLVDRAGEYEGVYANTGPAGIYTFNFTASDVSGKRFLPCTGSADVVVNEPAGTPTPIITNTPTATPTDTPSPTPTSTNTPTPTATFTPTPPPAVNTLPQLLETTLCSLQDTIAIRVDNVVDLAVVEMEVAYDPAIIQVIDADASQRDVQVRVDESFSTDTIFRNEVDTSRGRISFGAGVIGIPATNGSSGLIAIDWRPQRVGRSAVTIESISLSDVNGQPISAAVQGGAVEVQFVPNCLSGTVALQGRNEHGGTLVTNGNGDRAVTQADGSFSISESDTLTFEFPAFVAAEVNLQQTLAAKQTDQPIKLASITLLAGDINGDNTVDILDLAYLATKYQTTDSLADLNADGAANILDLALLAGNFQQQGPVVSSQ